MQTITFNDTDISAYIFDDDISLVASHGNTSCPSFIIGDMNSTNSTIHEGVTSPEDWEGGKYLFDGSSWTLNSDWVSPVLPV